MLVPQRIQVVKMNPLRTGVQRKINMPESILAPTRLGKKSLLKPKLPLPKQLLFLSKSRPLDI
jgi:hypothetical protein